jgi:hypothetical protein
LLRPQPLTLFIAGPAFLRQVLVPQVDLLDFVGSVFQRT